MIANVIFIDEMSEVLIPNFEIPQRQPPKRSERKKELYTLLFARSDMSAALEACKLFIATVNSLSHPLYYPLYAAIVVCYVRPFTNNKPFGTIPKRYNRFDGNSEYKELHKELIKYRHEFIAHNDMTLRQAMIVPRGVTFGKINGKDMKFSGIGTAINNDFHPIEKFARIHDLIKFNGGRIEKDIKELTNFLYGGMELPTQKFELRIDEGL